MKISFLLHKAYNLLKKHSSNPALDARLLLSHATKIEQKAIILEPDLTVTQTQADCYMDLVNKRIKREPIAKIIGKKSFWMSDFLVNQHTLDPRPDSEVIITAAINLIEKNKENLMFLDLGVGSGCLILSLLQEFSSAQAIATDISLEALHIAQQNAQLLGLRDRVTLLHQNWGDNLSEEFDLIVSNPPYIPSKEIENLEQEVKFYDPLSALDGGEDGLSHYRYLNKQIHKLLKPQAYAILEFGYNQATDIINIFQSHYKIITILKDLSHNDRAIIIQKN